MTALRHDGRAVPTLPFLIVLLLALVEFGQAWYYPGGERGVEVTRAFGGAFRLLLWLFALAAILVHVLRRGPRPMLRVLWPFAPFILWGAIVVGFWSVDRITGVRALIFWSLASGLAAAAGHELDPRTLARGVAVLFCTIVAASLALAVILPEAAYTYYGDEFVVRGLFPHKNQLGWYCAVGCCGPLRSAATSGRRSSRSPRRCCLPGSSSPTRRRRSRSPSPPAASPWRSASPAASSGTARAPRSH